MVTAVPQPTRKPSEVAVTSQQCVEDSERWFGDTISVEPGQVPLPFFALCLAGEVGEFCNIVKKVERGSLDIRESRVRFDMTMELADVYTYLCLIAGLMGVDLQHAYEYKRTVNEKRFAEQRRDREAARREALTDGMEVVDRA
jgi:NTP pyrophosphatase (non-canonical NTP hydrolase)